MQLISRRTCTLWATSIWIAASILNQWQMTSIKPMTFRKGNGSRRERAVVIVIAKWQCSLWAVNAKSLSHHSSQEAQTTLEGSKKPSRYPSLSNSSRSQSSRIYSTWHITTKSSLTCCASSSLNPTFSSSLRGHAVLLLSVTMAAFTQAGRSQRIAKCAKARNLSSLPHCLTPWWPQYTNIQAKCSASIPKKSINWKSY